MGKNAPVQGLTWQSPLTALKGVGKELGARLSVFGLHTVGDLIDHWPRRYDDYSNIVRIKDIAPGLVTVRARIGRVSSRRARRGLHVTQALASDNTGSLSVVWFNQPYRAAGLKAGKEYFLSGSFDMHSGRLVLSNPRVEEADDTVNSGKILAVYPETKGIQSSLLRRLIEQVVLVIETIPETLPEEIVSRRKLMSRAEAILALHLPSSNEILDRAKARLSFEELFQLQLASQLIRQDLEQESAPRIPFVQDEAARFVSHLPYTPTDDQRRVVWQIYKDMDAETPMNRLVEGDVGSGKTLVAAMAAAMAMRAGYQVLYMAPTEILARQHANTLTELFAHTEWKDRIGLLVGGLKKAQKTALHDRIKQGDCRFVVGTHALIQDAVVCENVGLVIIDEQHRFGVEQRQRLRQKGGVYPHFLSMTATPIPRTLALTLYGELDLSVIKALPSGRKPIVTEIILHPARHQLYQRIDAELAAGRQAFVVCPLIQESDALQVQAAEVLHQDLVTKQLKHRRIGLLHGKLKSEEKDEIMAEFAAGRIDVLVSTTVIEVGVNVPNATVMVIEGAERFGLAQIHQLRGRIGRGEHQSYCYLVPSQDIGMTKRLQAVASTQDGFKLAELDLDLRGPGAIYGVRQSGVLDLRIAELGDRASVQLAKDEAVRFIRSGLDLLQYKELASRVAHFRSVTKLN